jgi:hypothetical protein
MDDLAELQGIAAGIASACVPVAEGCFELAGSRAVYEDHRCNGECGTFELRLPTPRFTRAITSRPEVRCCPASQRASVTVRRLPWESCHALQLVTTKSVSSGPEGLGGPA